MVEKSNFIEVYKNVFDDNFCENVINLFNTVEQDTGFIKTRQSLDKVPKLYKEDKAIFIPEATLDMKHTTQKLCSEFNRGLWEVAYPQYAEKYGILHTLEQHKSYINKIQKTEPGQGYHIWHCEAGDRDSANRLLTWTVYLNDDYEAGETEFLYQHYRYKPCKGDIVMFPAAFTHTHRGNPPIGGTKYIITGWIEF